MKKAKPKAKKPTKKLVSSKSELTTKDVKSLSIKEYHKQVGDISKEVKEFALGKSDNLLTVKMALMGAVRDIEKMMKERRE